MFQYENFPGGPVVKNLPANAGDMGSILGWETKIPHAMGQLRQLAKQSYLARALESMGSRAHRLNSCCARLSCPMACGILVPRPGIEPLYPALEGGFLTTGLPGKAFSFFLSL